MTAWTPLPEHLWAVPRPPKSNDPNARPRPPWAARPPWPGIALIAAAAVAVEMAVSARYGYVRDELYFLSAGQHLAFGYVDQPPLTPLLARITAALTGNTLVGLRILPALALAALVVMTAAMSRRLGAGRTGQLLAALAAATCGEYLGAMHELTTTTPDLVFWAITLLLVMQLLASQDRRWWVAIGGCVGVASEAKWNIGFLLAALAAGFAFTDARRLLRSRYLLIGGLIAAALAAPDVVWQAAHGWPGLDVFRALQTEAGHNRAVYWPGADPLYRRGADPGMGGRRRLVAAQRRGPALPAGGDRLRDRDRAAVRPGRQGVLPGCRVHVPARGRLRPARAPPRGPHACRAAGLAGRAPRAGWSRPRSLAGAAMVAGALPAAPVALSVLPARALHAVPLQKINYDLAETIAWPKLVALVAQEYDSLPTAQRRRTTILAGNYGEAGAIERYGPGPACRRPTAAPTTSGSGARRPPPTPRPSR